MQLRIEHQSVEHQSNDSGETKVRSFRVGRLRQGDLKQAPVVEVSSPHGHPVENSGEALTQRLRWYLERYLEYPFPPRTAQAKAVEAALEGWGRSAYQALFGSGQAYGFMLDAKREGSLDIQISSDDPEVLSWPWEALHDAERGVWANFESVCGIEGTDVKGLLPEEDRVLLGDFLTQLRGGKTKVLITSRSQERWLGPKVCFRLPLGALRGEEVWAFAGEVLDDLGLHADPTDAPLGQLLDALDGHPLLMQVVLSELESRSAPRLLDALKKNLSSLGATPGTDAAVQKLFATLDLGIQSLPDGLKQYLLPLGLHQEFVEQDLLKAMAKPAELPCDATELHRFFAALSRAGLVTDMGQNVFRMHPLLTSYLRERVQPSASPRTAEGWARGFVDVMGTLADQVAPKELHEQRLPFAVHGSNFAHARALARKLSMNVHYGALTQGLAAYAQNTRDFDEARRLCEDYAANEEGQEDPSGAAAPYHQLGRIAEEQRDFATAEKWYLTRLSPFSGESLEATAIRLQTSGTRLERTD